MPTSYKVRLILIAVALGLYLAIQVPIWSDLALNYTVVQGRVLGIVRLCEFKNVAQNSSDKTSLDDCNATGELALLLNQGSRPTRKVEGEATVAVSYYSPVDGQPHTSCYKLFGREDAFYTVRIGEVVNLYAHKREAYRITSQGIGGARPGEPGCPAQQPS